MSGKAGELLPTYKKDIQPSAPSSPTPSASRSWVAWPPSQEGLAAMQTCHDIVQRMRAANLAKKEKKSGGKLSKKTLVGFSGTWFIWHLEDVSVAEAQKRSG